jgi:phytoene desaturase
VARVVVVGAGVAGLASAARLADLGHEVTVLEQAPTVGGALATYARDGYRFDTGEPTLTLPAVFRDLFRVTGRPLERELELVPVEPSWRCRFADGLQVDLSNASRAETITSLDDALGADAGQQWAALLRHGEQIWRAVRGYVLDRPLTGRNAAAFSARPARLRAIGAGSSLRAWTERVLPEPRLRALVETQTTWTGSDPRQAPAVLAVLPYLEHAFGTWYVAGGMHRLAEVLAERATACGATIRMACPVGQVLVTGDRVSGVRLPDGETISADVVVAATHPEHLYGELIDDPPYDERQRLAGTAAPPSIFTLLLALRDRTPNLAHHMVLLPEDMDAELDWLWAAWSGSPPQPTLHVCVPDDPSTRPAHGEGWTVHVRVPRHGRGVPGALDWTTDGIATSFADRLLDVLATRGHDVRERVLWRVIRTPADRERETRVPGGAVGGLALCGLRSAWRRPSNRSSIPGLYLVGAATHPGPGLALAARSASITADLIGRAT